jgi:hypothetical protein
MEEVETGALRADLRAQRGFGRTFGNAEFGDSNYVKIVD